VDGTSNVLDLALQLPSPPRIVFASTCHVYDRVNKTAPVVCEGSPLNPISAYGQTKLLGEQEIQRRVAISSLDACIVRGFHHIGPRQPAGLMLTDWLAQIGPDCPEIKVRSTNSYLDLVDVRDAARAYYLLANKETSVGVCNLGSGRISRSGDVLDALLAQVNHPINIAVESDREQWNAIADTSVLNSLNWKTKINYEQTISDMLSYQTASRT
jgi:GDP-4-dehydro-6-deoxy-D-mannose reductase